MDDIIEACCHCKIFKGLDKAKIKSTLSKLDYQIRQYDKNEFICREDQYSMNVGIIIYGQIEVQKNLTSGNSLCIFYKDKGEAFGGAVSFSSESLYPCDVFSRDKSKIVFINKQSIFLMCKNPVIAENLLKSFANRIIYYEKRLELFSYSSIQKKIAFFLLDEMRTTNNTTIYLPFSKKSWAEYLNVSRPSLCRELKKLSNDNILEINRQIIVIKSEGALIRLLQQ